MESQLSDKEQRLWRLAKKRVGFKRHFAVYIIINAMLWCLWFYTDHNSEDAGIPWPVFPMIGWGIGILFNFLDAYLLSRDSAVEKEFEKLKNKRS